MFELKRLYIYKLNISPNTTNKQIKINKTK